MLVAMEDDNMRVQQVAERNLVLECNRDTDVYMGYVGLLASSWIMTFSAHVKDTA